MTAVCFQTPWWAPGPVAPSACEQQSRAPRCVPAPAHPPLPAGIGWDGMPSKRLHFLSPAVGPALLIPVYFQYQIIMSMIVYKKWAVSRGARLGWDAGRRGVWVRCLRRAPRVPLWGPGHLLWGWLPCHSERDLLGSQEAMALLL